jgi:hypothetical protein
MPARSTPLTLESHLQPALVVGKAYQDAHATEDCNARNKAWTIWSSLQTN